MFLQKLEEQHKMNSLKNAAIIYNGVKGKASKNMVMGTDMDMDIQKMKRVIKKAREIF